MENNKRVKRNGNSRFVEEAHQQALLDSRNPLLNDVVLTRLFELCHASDLPRFRLVSKKWHALASDSFRRDVPVTFESPWSSSGRHRFESFFELDPEKTPFGNFRLEDMDIGQLPFYREISRSVEFLTCQQHMAQFCRSYGSYIRKLVLLRPVIHNVDAFKKLILEDTPNLEELSLFGIQDKTRSPSGNFDGGNVRMQLKLKRLVVSGMCCVPVGWDLLPHFPNIQSVEVTPPDLYNVSMDNATITRHLTNISKQLGLIQSKTRRSCRITVHKPNFLLRSQEHAELSKIVLQMPQILLPKLSFTVKEFNDREDCEMDFLSTAILHHGENLEDLYVCSLSRQSPYDNCPFKLGPFNSMTSIRLRGNLCENLHFLKHFPNLKILKMFDFDEELLERTESTIMETFTLQALKDLSLRMSVKHITKDIMEMIVKVMPSVETFRSRLINESLRVVCRDWKQLKDLTLETSPLFHLPINDEGITGIVSGREERLPNITDLKDLKAIYIYQLDGLSDASIWQGFLKMPNLEYLRARISEDASENAFRALTRKFPYSEITHCSSVL